MLHGVPQHYRFSTYLCCAKQGACHQKHVMHFLLATLLLALHSYQVSLTKTSCDHFRPPYPTLVLAGFQFTCMIFCLGTLCMMNRSLPNKQKNPEVALVIRENHIVKGGEEHTRQRIPGAPDIQYLQCPGWRGQESG